MKKLSSFLSLIVLMTLVAVPASEATATTSAAIISKLIATESEVTATYQLPSGCIMGKEELIILNSKNASVTQKYYAAPGEVLTALVSFRIDSECPNPTLAVSKTMSFLNPTGYQNIVAWQPVGIAGNEAPNVPVTQTQRSIRFVAMMQSGEGLNPFTLEELSYVAGQPLKRTVLGAKGINAILGQNAAGLVVKTFSGSKVQTWLVTTKSWKLLSNKVIYIEPGVLTPDNRYLIGRKVADAPSTKIISQDLKTGSLTTLFDTAKNGKGFVCGAYSDPTDQFAYFSHIASQKTNVYRIDLKTKKLKLLGRAMPGFCISSVIPSGRLAGIVRDRNYNVGGVLVANEKNPDTARYFSANRPSGGFQARIGSDAGPYTLVTNDLFVLVTEGASDLYLMGLPSESGGSPIDFGWEGPVIPPTFMQFMRLLPASWQNTEVRALQP